MSDDEEWSSLCMMCSKEADGRWEWEKRFEDGRDVWILWVYCCPCDCWTEHPPTTKGAPR